MDIFANRMQKHRRKLKEDPAAYKAHLAKERLRDKIRKQRRREYLKNHPSDAEAVKKKDAERKRRKRAEQKFFFHFFLFFIALNAILFFSYLSTTFKIKFQPLFTIFTIYIDNFIQATTTKKF